MRSTRCDCYKCAMGTQGLSGRALSGRRGGDASWLRIAALAVSFAVLPLAVGCSQSSPFGSSAPQASAVPPPPPAYGQAPGQPAYAQQPVRPGYPPQAQGGSPPPSSYATAPPAQQADGTVGSMTSSYSNFLKAFRDPEPDPSSEAARASVYPQRSLADLFKGSDSNQRPDPAGAGYPQQALVPAAASGANPPQQNAYIPHPPSTYTPSGQPYTPPPGQSGYVPPPATPQNYVPPPNPPRSGQQSSGKPSTQQAARTKPQNPPPQAAYNPPPPAPVAPAAPPAQSRDYSDSMPYPKQSLTDMFSGSTQSQAQSVPQPPSSYTPSGQPYSPQGQTASAAPAASAPPANPDASSSGAYPKQSLFEVFSGK